MNGGITSVDQVALHSSNPHLAGAMAGRWMLRRPFDLLTVGGAINEQQYPEGSHLKTRALVITQYMDYACSELTSASRDEGVAVFAPVAVLWLFRCFVLIPWALSSR